MEEVFFAMVEVVRAGHDCILDPDLGGAFTHVAARAADDSEFLAIVAASAREQGLSLGEVEWVATADGLSRAQVESDYYVDLLPQLEDEAVAWAEFCCYPLQDEPEPSHQAEASEN